VVGLDLDLAVMVRSMKAETDAIEEQKNRDEARRKLKHG